VEEPEPKWLERGGEPRGMVPLSEDTIFLFKWERP
jgi:hypothetical protein